jgi:hypothetical protein
MATNRASHQFGRRNAAPAVKIAAVVLGLTALGYLAGTLGEYPFPHSKAASAVAIEYEKVDTGPASGVPDSRVSTPASPASDVHDETRGANDLPRECDLRHGIDSACIFN